MVRQGWYCGIFIISLLTHTILHASKLAKDNQSSSGSLSSSSSHPSIQRFQSLDNDSLARVISFLPQESLQAWRATNRQQRARINTLGGSIKSVLASAIKRSISRKQLFVMLKSSNTAYDKVIDNQGNTMAHYAALYGDVACFYWWQEMPFHDLENDGGATPFDYAVINAHKERNIAILLRFLYSPIRGCFLGQGFPSRSFRTQRLDGVLFRSSFPDLSDTLNELYPEDGMSQISCVLALFSLMLHGDESKYYQIVLSQNQQVEEVMRASSSSSTASSASQVSQDASSCSSISLASPCAADKTKDYPHFSQYGNVLLSLSNDYSLDYFFRDHCGINTQLGDGMTFLHYLCMLQSASQKTIEAMIACGADFNVQDSSGRSPLWYLCWYNELDAHTIRLLRLHGADFTMQCQERSPSTPAQALCYDNRELEPEAFQALQLI